MFVSIPFVRGDGEQWSFSSCSMYDRNYSGLTEAELLDFSAEGSSTNSSGCQFGWKFEFNDPETTSVVADVRLVLISIDTNSN